jgi:hypothetical protein
MKERLETDKTIIQAPAKDPLCHVKIHSLLTPSIPSFVSEQISIGS